MEPGDAGARWSRRFPTLTGGAGWAGSDGPPLDPVHGRGAGPSAAAGRLQLLPKSRAPQPIADSRRGAAGLLVLPACTDWEVGRGFSLRKWGPPGVLFDSPIPRVRTEVRTDCRGLEYSAMHWKNKAGVHRFRLSGPKRLRTVQYSQH